MIRPMSVRDKTLAVFGRNVAHIRDERGFSQDKLAEKTDLDRTYLSGIERGVRNPGMRHSTKPKHADQTILPS